MTHIKIIFIVHCAGINHFKPIEKVTVDEAKQVMNVNVTGPIYLTSLCIDCMKQLSTKPHIITVSAFAGVLGIPFNSVYAASKFAIEGYFESIREEVSVGDKIIRYVLKICLNLLNSYCLNAQMLSNLTIQGIRYDNIG